MGIHRLNHAVLYVSNLERSVAFYTGPLGMTEIRRREVPAGKYTLAFVGYGDGAEIELTYNWDQETPYEVGSGFGHLAVGMPDIAAVCDRIRAAGARVTREPGPVQHGTTVIAFVEDPDGYKVELIQRG